jgi:hypothetical protein
MAIVTIKINLIFALILLVNILYMYFVLILKHKNKVIHKYNEMSKYFRDKKNNILNYIIEIKKIFNKYLLKWIYYPPIIGYKWIEGLKKKWGKIN